ncbi:hypothetical protein GJAV_G00244880 [Gymnothorax javanicus]|nr:hypothetical protein GJAV_G00244880 [Gymnothorax javanicus]
MPSPVAVLLLVFCVSFANASALKTKHRLPRMVGGNLSDVIPWQVLLHFDDSVFEWGNGGGALISDRWILTSGRNVFLNKTRLPTQRQPPTTFPKVYLGVTNRKTLENSTEVEIEKVVVHPDFQKTASWENNLALIKLKQPVTITERVMPIPLPKTDQHENNGKAVVAGWGWGHQFIFSDFLKFLVIPVVDQALCKAEYEKNDEVKVDNRTICTGPTENKENVCVGDEGGALAVLDPKGNKVYAAGILSYDKNCQVDPYAVYTKLTAYLPWIHYVMSGDTEELSAKRTAIMQKKLSGGESTRLS